MSNAQMFAGSAGMNAMVARVAPAILELLADGAPRRKLAIVEAPCCTDQRDRRTNPSLIWPHTMRTEFGRPSSSMRFRTSTAMATSVA